MKEGVVLMEAKYIDTLYVIREIPGLKAADDDGYIWVRGIVPNAEPDQRILALPLFASYTLDEQERLFPAGGITPVGLLKALNWIPIKEFLTVEMPVSALPGATQAKIKIRLTRSSTVRESHALLTGLADWKNYAETAPQIRLKQLCFAVSGDGEALITGDPLPAIPGRRFWLNHQLLIPEGFDFDPPVIGDLANAQINTDDPSLALFNSDGSWQQIPLSNFKEATRSAIRLTNVIAYG